MRFEGLPARTTVVTAGQITAARAAARTQGHPGAALAYAIQFEGAARQWDVIGQWFPLSDSQPSAIISRGRKWIGPTWANIDANLILRFKPTKTDRTTAPEVVIDLRACPMVMEELQDMPPESRNGPLIVDRKHGLPYHVDRFVDAWLAAANAAGIPRNVWNRDLRASGTTEAREADAKTDDLKKLLGHSAGSATTAAVYDRAHLEAHRRIAEARKIHRGKKS